LNLLALFLSSFAFQTIRNLGDLHLGSALPAASVRAASRVGGPESFRGSRGRELSARY
jgi:hypothetical protein